MSNFQSNSLVVLLGGGIESTHLVAQAVQRERAVLPVHVNGGLLWDAAEVASIRRFLADLNSPCIHPLQEISLPLAGFLGHHWAVTGIEVPRAGERSARLEIPLRNLTLLALAVHCCRQFLPRDDLTHDDAELVIALGTTVDNSFPDGSREYFDLCEPILSREAGRPVRIDTPLIRMHKADVIRNASRGALARSFSCVDPQSGQHCGLCIKCGSRRAAFVAAGVTDPTEYASGGPSR